MAGTAHMQLGATTNYELLNDPATIPDADTWQVTDDWTPPANSFTPGKTYHWRMCFTPNVGSAVCGVDQTFVAAASDSLRPTINSITYLGAEAGTALDPVTSPSASFRLAFSEPVRLGGCLSAGIGGVSTGQIDIAPPSGLAQTFVVTFPDVSGQGHIGLTVGGSCSAITDAAGNTLSNSASKDVQVDRPVPDTIAPTIATTALPGVSLATPLQKWTATDAVGLASFQLKTRTTTRAGVTSAWSAPTLLARTVRQAPITIIPGTTRCDQVTVYDTSQNKTAGTVRCTTTPLDERATLKTGTWTSYANASAFTATLSRSLQIGATRYLPGVKGHSVVLVARKQPGAGTVQVLVNGAVKYTWNLASPTVQNKQVLNLSVPAGFTNAAVSVRVKAPGTTGVYIDALGVGA